jgi:hypothetical protein
MSRRRGCSLPANASGLEPHRASISSRFGQVRPEETLTDVVARVVLPATQKVSAPSPLLGWAALTENRLGRGCSEQEIFRVWGCIA